MPTPLYTKLAIKLAFAPKDALDYETCLQKRYSEIAHQEGREEADRMVREEILPLLIQIGVRWGRIFLFFHLPPFR